MAHVKTEKRCTRCRQVKPLSEYWSNGRNPYTPGMCIICKRIRNGVESIVLTRAMLQPCEPFCPLVSKRCVRCEEVRAAAEFRLKRGKRVGTCGECEKADRQRDWRAMPAEKRERRYAYRRNYGASRAGRRAVSESNRKTYLKNRGQRIEDSNRQRLLKRYNLTLEEKNRMIAERGGLCDICREAPKDGRLCVDHCHITGQVRGILCLKCNSGIGLLRDDVELLESAIAYLLQHEAGASAARNDEAA